MRDTLYVPISRPNVPLFALSRTVLSPKQARAAVASLATAALTDSPKRAWIREADPRFGTQIPAKGKSGVNQKLPEIYDLLNLDHQ